MFKFTNIVIKFVSTKDINTAYSLHLRELKDSLKALSTEQELRQAELELKGLVAIIENKIIAEYNKSLDNY
jgi:hypothetical protein